MNALSRTRSTLMFALLLVTSACGGGVEEREARPSTPDSRNASGAEEDRLRVGGNVDVLDYGSVMDFIVTGGGMQLMDARVTFDGMPVEYDMARGTYNLVEFYGSVFHSGRSVEVCAAWQEELVCRTLTAPGSATIMAPRSQDSLSSSQMYPVYWRAAAGAVRYDVSVLASDSSLLNFLSTNDVSYWFSPHFYTGPATISVAAVALMPDSDLLGELTVSRVSQVSFTFVD
ncbi:MAG TPA: hypothetical protein VF815_06545 [Myxococcaceae bacterium]|jgi:hypothetical protein